MYSSKRWLLYPSRELLPTAPADYLLTAKESSSITHQNKLARKSTNQTTPWPLPLRRNNTDSSASGLRKRL